MTVPAFNDPFNYYYDDYSVRAETVIIPDHFDIFLPDNQDDYNCINVISPSTAKGAKRWTFNNKWITIGIYRDEGRAPAQRPIINNLSWTRDGATITITNPAGHKLEPGESIDVYNVSIWNKNNINLPNILVNTIIDDYSFTINDIRTTTIIDGQMMLNAAILFAEQNPQLGGFLLGMFGQEIGDKVGTAASYRENFITNFYETYRVFRLLPSFELVKYSEIQDIFTSSAPPQKSSRRSLYSVTSSQVVPVPGVKTKSINYELPTQSQPKDENTSLKRRFSQVYDEAGQPLKLTYNTLGFPAQIINVDSPFKNDQIFYNNPVNPSGDDYIFIYDYYGLSINDISRGPYSSTTNVVRNLAISGSINNLTNNITDLYNSTLNDAYANLVIGVQQNNALIIRKQILPLELDAYNRPVKSPL